ncbi:MAG TPA: DUF945 family protein [Polyangiales bacterium]|nr:DUF945 family protein [Polyangiales bacterium]
MKNKAAYIAIGVVLLLGAATAGASAYTGRAVTSRLSQQTAQVGKLVPELHVEEKIEPGLFRSSRQVKLQLGCAPLPAADGQGVTRSESIEVYWRDVVHHVPFLSARGKVASIDSELVIVSAGVEQLFGTRAPLTVHTNIDLQGRFESDAKLVAFKVAPKPGDELEFSGLSMHVTGSFPDGAGTFSYAGNSAPTRIRAKAEDGDFTASLGRMDLKGNLLIDPAAATFLLPYHSEARIGDMTVQVAGPARDGGAPLSFQLAVSGVTATADSKIADGLLSNTNHVQGSVKLDSFAIDKFEMASALNNLHVPTLTKLTRTWLSRSLSCEAQQSPEELLKQFDELAKSAFELLPYAPEYKVGPIAIELGGKRAELVYTVGVRGVAAGGAPDVTELMTKHAYANAEAKLHLGLVDQFAAWASKLGASTLGRNQQVALQQAGPDPAAMMARGMIEGFVQQGFLERDGETVRGKVEYAEGAVKLNGRPFELPDFGADLGAMKSLLAADQPDEQ